MKKIVSLVLLLFLISISITTIADVGNYESYESNYHGGSDSGLMITGKIPADQGKIFLIYYTTFIILGILSSFWLEKRWVRMMHVISCIALILPGLYWFAKEIIVLIIAFIWGPISIAKDTPLPTSAKLFFIILIYVSAFFFFKNLFSEYKSYKSKENEVKHELKKVFNYFKKLVAKDYKQSKYSSERTSPSIFNKERNIAIANEMKKYSHNFDEDDFKKQVCSIFIDFQTAWSERNKDSIRKIESDELFHQHSNQIQEFINNKQINIIDIINNHFSEFINYSFNSEKETVIVLVNAYMINYTINENTGAVIQGNAEEKSVKYFKLTLTRNKPQNQQSTDANWLLDNIEDQEF